MDKIEIRKRVELLTDKKDLLALLNDIVKDELGVDFAFAFSMKQINYYSNPNNTQGRYMHFEIPKKSGGLRGIDAPCKGLNNILYFLNIMLKAIYVPSDFAMGFVEGRSVVDNATRHLNQNYVFNTDIENFFPSIEQPRVRARLMVKPFNLNKAVANIVAGLCCIKIIRKDGTAGYVLPQGASTSPLLTNAICDNLDRRLSGVARRFNLTYSRYADDITFSSMHNVYQENGLFIQELKKVIEGQGFRINSGKTRCQKKGQHQEVTGIIVSSKLNTPSKYISEIRNVLHIWEKYGYADASKRFYSYYKKEKGHVKKGDPLIENYLHGKLQYLKMIKGEHDGLYEKLNYRLNKLTETLNDSSDDKYVTELNNELDDLLKAI